MPVPSTPQKPIKLELTTTSLNNCVIANDSDAVFFEIVTPKWEPNSTKIRRPDPNTKELELVAELEKTADGDDPNGKGKGKQAHVRLRGEQFRPVNEFLKRDESEDTGKGRV